MEARFPNGSSVSRIWRDQGEGELLAAFQYEFDAIAFAKAKVAEDAKRQLAGSFYVVACALRGTVQIVKAEEKSP